MTRTTLRQVSVTRPANATQYTAGDAVGAAGTSGAVLQFPPTAPSNSRSGKVMSARLWKADTDVVADGFSLDLFQKVPTAVPADHAAPTTDFINIADVGSYIGTILFNAGGIVLAGGVYYEGEGTLAPTGGLPFVTDGDDGVLYGILTAVGTYTPASGEVFTVTLEIQE